MIFYIFRETKIENPRVGGSNPPPGTRKLHEYQNAKTLALSSYPGSSSGIQTD